MRRVSARDFKMQFDEFIDLVRDEPIEVLRGGKVVGAFVSTEEYAHLERLDDAYWAARARAAEAEQDEQGRTWTLEELEAGVDKTPDCKDR
jgi:PHD/YefM family antitoxin component YafN of YafNO toxin-antitoxin module